MEGGGGGGGGGSRVRGVVYVSVWGGLFVLCAKENVVTSVFHEDASYAL